MKLSNLDAANGPLSPFVQTFRLRTGDALELPLSPKVCLKLSKNSQHINESLAGGGRGIHRLLRRSKRYPFLLKVSHYRL